VVSGTLVAPPGIPTVLGATWEFGSVAGSGTLVAERPVVVVEELFSERTPLELEPVWASARAALPLRAAAASKAVR
jgi:hypothetical protein